MIKPLLSSLSLYPSIAHNSHTQSPSTQVYQHILFWRDFQCAYVGTDSHSSPVRNGGVCCPVSIPRGTSGKITADMSYSTGEFKTFSICSARSAACVEGSRNLVFEAADTSGRDVVVCVTPTYAIQSFTIDVQSVINVPTIGIFVQKTSKPGQSKVCVTPEAMFSIESTAYAWATDQTGAVIRPKSLYICETGDSPMPSCTTALRNYRNVRANGFRYLSKQEACVELFDSSYPSRFT